MPISTPSSLKAHTRKRYSPALGLLALLTILLAPMTAFCADPARVFHLNPEFEEGYKFSIGVRSGDFLIIGGITAVDEQGNEVHADNPRKQMQLIYQRLEKILAAHGATAKNVVKETIYYGIDNEKYFSTLDIRSDFYKDVAGPSTSGVKVAGFTSENILIELTAVAYLGK